MSYSKIHLVTLLAIIISLSIIIQVQSSTTTKDANANVTTITNLLANSLAANSDLKVTNDIKEIPVTLNSNTTRTGRVMKILSELKTIRKRTRIPTKIRARADYFPPPPLGPQQSPAGATGQRLPPFLQRRPQLYAGPYSGTQIHRRVHNSIGPAPPRFPGYEVLKSSRFSPVKGGHQYPSGKGSVYRSQFAGQQHPNAVSGVIQQYGPNFKASPTFSGKAIVLPVTEQQPQQQEQQYPQYMPQQQQTQLQQYQSVKQYPIPQQQQQHHRQQQQQQYHELQREREREHLLASGYEAAAAITQQSQTHYKQQPLFHYEQTNPYQGAQVKYENPERPTYSVYEEEPEPTEQRVQIPINQQDQQDQQPAYNHNYYVSSTEIAAKEAQEYLKFMSSNDYFLPKHEPNYRQLDADKEQRLGVYQQQQPSQAQPQQLPHHSIKYSKPITEAPPTKPPIQVSQFFYQEDPAANSAVVRGSYQAGNNVFVVNSDGNKAVKHIVHSPLPAIANQVSTTSTPIYSQAQYNSIKSRTPEPLRFEFTERDAVPSSYTNSPIGQQQQPQQQQHLRYKSVGVPSTPRDPQTISTGSIIGTSTTSSYNDIKSNGNVVHEHDAEDDDDMQEAGSNTFGRVPVHSAVGTSSEPPAEQKDTEDYCERICANVEDEDEEIVCGSDGYMYTSEPQMECYSSCLHIDVTIQSKGVCNSS